MSENVVKKGTIVYLRINRDWYQYDEAACPIGSGAMGIVYLGFNAQTHMRVAIKMVRPEYANVPAIRMRAVHESSLMFMHRNLIEMLGCCELAPNSGPIWIISKFVQGVTIDKFLANYPREQKSTANRICNMYMSVLDALHYLHTSPQPILHLDIKPSNIMIENGNNVRLMDLGIATTEEGFHGGSRGMMGTPNYAAPEQFDRSCGDVNESTDVYEAGVTLYELLTKKNPYDSSSLHETIKRHNRQILPQSNYVPPEILRVLRKATSAQQGQRYSTIASFKNDLRMAMANPLPQNHSNLGLIISIISIVAIIIAIVITVIKMY